MADIDSGDAQRFKLFGTTIAVQVKEEMVKGDDQGTAQQRTGRIIPCPRCKSMETKFCYFNNYNINQPRHFCRSCQRYWTAGGTLRNIPVGAGRRKTKPSTHRPIRLSDNFIFDASTVDEFLHGGMVEQWCMMTSGSGFRKIFPAKRLSDSQARQIF